MAAFVIFLALVCGARSASAQVTGVVRDADTHEPIVDASVDMIATDRAASTHYTDTNGEFRVGVADGDYQILVRKMGYSDARQPVTVAAGHSTYLEIELHREQPSSAAPGNAKSSPPETVSPEELQHEQSIPESARDDYASGKSLANRQDYSKAIAQFQKAVGEFPSYYEAYADMGVAQYMAGRAAEAHASLETAITLSKSKYAPAFFDLADIMNDLADATGDMQDCDQAESLARQDIALEPSSWQGHLELARALKGEKRYAEAEQSAKRSLDLHGPGQQLYALLTNVHIEMRNYAAVLQDIDSYLKLDPRSATSQQMRATRQQVEQLLARQQKPAPAH